MKLSKINAFGFSVGIMFLSCLVFQAYAADCGDALSEGTWKGVVGYHNGADQGTGNSCGVWTDLGYEWQCVNYARKFYWAAGLNSKDQSIWQGDGEDYFGTADRLCITDYQAIKWRVWRHHMALVMMAMFCVF